jgi:hypothetical protein
MTDSSDYPAAHSMDTMWFAVDADGNVAVFESGEAGAVPVEGYVGEEYFDLLDELRSLGHESEVIWEVGRLQGSHSAPGFGGGPAPYLLLLRSTDAIANELDYASARRITTSGLKGRGQGVIIDELSQELHVKLHEKGDCLGCALHFEDEDAPNPASYGLFRYEHSCENWMSGPYTIDARPEKPLKAASLPDTIAEHCLRVERKFTDLPSINPPEHWACESWQSAWLHSDGKTVRPFPGRESEFRRDVKDLGPEFVIEHGAGGAGKKRWWKFW